MEKQDIFRQIFNTVSRAIWNTGAFSVARKEPFILASGKKSNFYINCRLLISYPHIRKKINSAAAHIYRMVITDVDCIAGGATAGIPFSFLLSHKLGLPYIYIRKSSKGYGLRSRIEGYLKKGSRVLLYEDLITDGKSKKSFIAAIRAAGCSVKSCLVIFDRQKGGEKLLKKERVELISMCNLIYLLDYGLKNKFIEPDKYRKIKEEI